MNGTLRHRLSGQAGVVLFVALVVLLVLSLLGVLAATTAQLESKMARDVRERSLAEIGAYSALAEGSARVRAAGAAGADQVCSRLTCVSSAKALAGASAAPGEVDLSVDLSAPSPADLSARAAAASRWAVIDAGSSAPGAAAPVHAYRVLAIGFGSEPQYVATVDATIALTP